MPRPSQSHAPFEPRPLLTFYGVVEPEDVVVAEDDASSRGQLRGLRDLSSVHVRGALLVGDDRHSAWGEELGEGLGGGV